MRILSLLCLVSSLLLPVPGARAQALAYRFTTLAGHPFFGSSDGTGSAAGFSFPHGVATDRAGNVYVTDAQNHTIRKITPVGVVTTLAGLAGSPGSADGTGSAARFNLPYGVAVDQAGNVYVGDMQNNTIRKITPAGVVTTLAGLAGAAGSTDGTGGAARFDFPAGVAVDLAGNVFVADSANHTIRRISPTGFVTTVAGNATESRHVDGPAAKARFFFPVSVAVDDSGNIYVIDIDEDTVRKISPTGEVTTVAGLAGNSGSADGTGSEARFAFPLSAAVDRAGNVFIADSFNHIIRRMTPAGVVTTVAGQLNNPGDADGVGLQAQFERPVGVAVDDTGNVFVADPNNSLIRKISPAGVVTSFAGGGSSGAEDGTGSAARFNDPQGVATDLAGNIYLADASNHVIRKITPRGVVTTFAGAARQPGSADGPAAAARFIVPRGLAFDRAGNLYVSDAANCTIRKITPSGAVTTLAGSPGEVGTADGQGSLARFYLPRGLAVAADGTVYVADQENSTIRQITPSGLVSTLAGRGGERGRTDGTGDAARFLAPAGLALDAAGNLYVSDNTALTIRKVTPAGVVTTLAGQYLTRGLSDGTGTGAQFNSASDLAIDRLGNLFVADGNNTLRQITPSGVVTTLVTPFGGFERYDASQGDRKVFFTTHVATDLAGNLIIVDGGNNTVRRAVSTTRLINLSVRTPVAIGEQAPFLGFVLSEGAPKSLLVRAVGPTLATMGVTDATTDPQLTLFDDHVVVDQQNDDWGGSSSLRQAFDALGAFPLPAGSKDAALLTTLPTGLYSARASAAGNAGGVTLLEAYDADPSSPSRLVNASIRTGAGVGDRTLIAGFVLSGTAPKTLLIRAIGPSLAGFGLGSSGLLADPRITLFRGATSIDTNDNWGGTPELKASARAVGAFDLASDASKDATLLVTLPPGVYTVHVTGADGGTGLALVELYELP